MNNVINLCSRKGACCPVANIHDYTKSVTITDDDGVSIILSWENIEKLYEEIQKSKEATETKCHCKSCQRGSAC